MLSHLVYPPSSASEQRRWPLILFLHGSGERGEDLQRVKRYGPPRYLEAGLELPAYLVAPQCPGDRAWDSLLDELEDLVEHLLKAYPIAADQISLTGFSMGGFGAWRWALHRPDRFSALAPVAGSGAGHEEGASLRDLCSLRRLPIWIIHGAADRHVPVEGADAYADALERCGATCRYSRNAEADHGETCRVAYGQPELYHWLMQQRRSQRPAV